jgi:two-component system LytT family response regulator
MSKNIRVFIADDEQKAIDTLAKALGAFFEHVQVVGTATTVADAYAGITDTRPDLLFLDIEMGTESGFQLLERFDKIDFHVAFVTAHEEFALRAIKFSAIDYIIKPAGVQELKALLLKVEQNPVRKSDHLKVQHMFGNFIQPDKNEHKITVAVAEGYDFIRVSDIHYLKADGSYTIFCLRNGSTLTTSKSLKFFESMLEGYGFFRIHHSTLINLRYIKRIHKTAGGSVVMEDNEEFSIAKSRKDEFLELLSLR